VLPERVLAFLRQSLKIAWRVLFRIRYKGTENIPQDDRRGLIIAANHQTYIDPFWLSIPINRPLRFLAWDAAFKWPIIGKSIQFLGAWPLQVEGSDPSAIRRTLEWLRDGGAVVIFPEGGRGQPDGSMIEFKGGAARLALEADVPILPVTIRGANRVWPAGRHLPRLAQVEITYHPPFRVEQGPNEEKGACARRETDRLAGMIRSAL
jgi:1-acyl-sn-glycerol-3-phosphate acyltransferase